MAIYPQNLHTHGPFCDGKADYEDTIKRAIEVGFDSIGFSGHSHTAFDTSYCMSEEDTQKYKVLINQLKEKYSGVIDVFCGIEFDIYSDDKLSGYDYAIVSAHYVKSGDKYLEIDPRTPADIKKTIDTCFGGNGLLLAKAFYEGVSANIPCKPETLIAGHFDLVTIHCEHGGIIDTDSDEYRRYALEAVSAVAEKIKVFEINVGAIARGYHKTPYPADFILKRVNELGCSVVISSDCHRPEFLDTNFDIGIELARSCGFGEVHVLTRNGFKGIKI